MYIDAHCHLADRRFDGIRNAVVARAHAQGITHFLQGGVDPDEWQRQETLAIPGLIPCFGLHPWFVHRADAATCNAALAVLETRLPQAIALGELGLDKGLPEHETHFEQQQEMFGKQLQLAKQHHKPLVLHVVRAHAEALALLKAFGPQWRGMVHGFTGSLEIAQAYMKLGLAISVGGAVGRNGYKKLKNALPYIPKDQLLVESDAPDMAIGGCSELNEPASIQIVAQKIGALITRSPTDILAHSRDNLVRIFNLELTT